ncbi:MAG: adenylate/guanylate cyclase domain-containing protein, partial [Panacagrimonas sp.]
FAQALKGRPIVMGYFFKPSVIPGEPATTGTICAPDIEKKAAALLAVDFIQPAGFGGNVQALQQAVAHCGFFDNPRVDADGIYRRIPLMQSYQGEIYPSLALAVLSLALGTSFEFEFDPPQMRTSLNLEAVRLGDVRIPVDEDVSAYVPYRGPYRTMPYVSVTDVLSKQADSSRLQDKIVLMGTSAAGLLDIRATPVGGVFPGVEIHASLIAGALDGSVRQKAPYYAGLETVMLLFVSLLMAWQFSRLSPLLGASLTGALVLGIGMLAFVMWSAADFVMPMGVPMLFTLTLFTAHLLYGYFIESRGKREISRLFGQYVPPQLVEEMAAHPESVSMEGEAREMTVLFSDVRSFTTISESLDARDLSTMMNRFLTKQTAVVQAHRGTIDKYMGDAVMAFWGAPLPDEHHALRALEAGIAMCQAVRELDAEFEKRGWPALNIGVGINSGRMSVGNMGSEFRMAYTVMGDAVNLGSRVEGLTKEYGCAVLCTEFTRALAPGDWAFREVDLVRVKGRSEPVGIYEPMGPKDGLDPALRQALARHRGAMKRYRAQQWDDAQREFETLCREDAPRKVYALFLRRIEYLRANAPGENWDGAFTFTQK